MWDGAFVALGLAKRKRGQRHWLVVGSRSSPNCLQMGQILHFNWAACSTACTAEGWQCFWPCGCMSMVQSCLLVHGALQHCCSSSFNQAWAPSLMSCGGDPAQGWSPSKCLRPRAGPSQKGNCWGGCSCKATAWGAWASLWPQGGKWLPQAFPLLWPRGGAVAPCLCQVGLPASYRLWEKALLAFTLKGTQIHPSLGSLALGFAGTTWKELVLWVLTLTRKCWEAGRRRTSFSLSKSLTRCSAGSLSSVCMSNREIFCVKWMSSQLGRGCAVNSSAWQGFCTCVFFWITKVNGANHPVAVTEQLVQATREPTPHTHGEIFKWFFFFFSFIYKKKSAGILFRSFSQIIRAYVCLLTNRGETNRDIIKGVSRWLGPSKDLFPFWGA